MSTAQIRLFSLIRREVSRFMKIKRQTLGGPLLETFLYISVFGAALGTRIHQIDGYRYIVFVIPGLIMMAWALNAFANNSSSILQQKFTHSIDDQLSSPASPIAVAARVHARRLHAWLHRRVADLHRRPWSLVSLPVAEPLVLIPALVLVGLFFAQCGVLVGVRAEQFDDVALYQTFVLQPLIFLGGVFYWASLLPEPWQNAHALQPGLLHDRARPVWVHRVQGHQHPALVRVPVLATAACSPLNYRIFAQGRYLRS